MKKILLIIFLLLISYNVKALTCEYKVDSNNIGIVVTIDDGDRGVNVSFGKGYYLMPGNNNNIGDFINLNSKSNCPNKVYYTCNASRFCKINTSYFTSTDAVISGSSDLKRSSGSNVPYTPGTATVSSVIEDFKSGNSCGAIAGLSDLVDTYIKIPAIVLGAVLFLVFTTIEYAKVVFAEDASPKKANENTLKRALGFGLLALSPYLIQLMLTLASIPAGC